MVPFCYINPFDKLSAGKILLPGAYNAPEAMNMEQGMNARRHVLTLEGRERASLSGVIAVCCFNEREIVLETSEGEIALLGEGLHIGQLNLDEGKLDVTGEIAGVEYNGPVKRKEKRGLFSRGKR